MATIPERYDYALRAIDSVYNQADKVRVYLNKFQSIPKELIDNKIETFIGKDLISSGKLFWAKNKNEYYFCIDDDLRYPKSYSDDMIDFLSKYNDRAIVSLHGKILNETPINSYFKGGVKELFHCLGSVETYSKVHVMGNGVSLFNTNYVKIDLDKFKYHYMDDIEVSIQMQEQEIPCVIMPHSENYLSYEEPNEIKNVKTLFSTYYHDDSTQTERINSLVWKIN